MQEVAPSGQSAPRATLEMTLNPSQLKAVATDDGLVVVMSGPGSGKTRTAVARVARLLRAGRRVLVLTFTNAAAHEFRERILGQLSTEARQTIHSVSECTSPAEFLTLHAYCWRLIRRYGHLLGYADGVSMLPPADADELLEEVRDSLGFKMSLRELHSLEVRADDAGKTNQVWSEYRFRLKRNNLVDYDRILVDGLALLRLDEVRSTVALDDLIVEEAQDSAAIDWSIYSAIPAARKFFIGDVDQAIFEFRQAYPGGLLSMIRGDDPISGAKVLTLEENYRCGSKICSAANHLIEHNKSRYEKNTRSATNSLGVVTVEGFATQWEEFERIAELINLHSAPMTGANRRSMAVLCRTNHDIKQVRDFLAARSVVSYHAYSRGRFNGPPDWRRATLLTGLVVAPFNEVIIEQLLRLDHPKATVADWKLKAHAEGGSLCDRYDGARAINTREQFLNYLAVNGVMESTVNLIQERLSLLPEDASIPDLLQDLHSHELFAQEQPSDTIYAGTIHSAKGREFDVVFLPMFEESRLNDQNIEEERRLAFVALTRARTHVHISFSRKRKPRWGDVTDRKPSRFIGEMGLGSLVTD